jgi:uncharacterized protein YacL
MLFVEVFRFLFVLAGAGAGLEVGHHVGGGSHGPIIGMLLGAAIFYVVGGVVGRLLDRGLQRAVFLLRNMPPGEVFAASIIATTGLLLGVVICLPLLALYRSSVELLVTAAVTWVLATLGWRLGAAKGRQVVAAAGLSRILAPPVDPPPGYALLVDASAIMDRFLLVLGRSGLLPGGLVIPQFVVDQVQTLADGPDPVSSRRARRGLESIEVLRESGVPVHVAPDEVPEVDDATTKVVTVARRLGLRIGTCSSVVVEMAGDWELPAVDLRRMTGDLTPDHPPGERLVIDLVKEGRQARQAVGYLPDGDMVVVNDAVHLVGTPEVEVTVLSTRPTAQGLMLFARLTIEDGSNRDLDSAPRATISHPSH